MGKGTTTRGRGGRRHRGRRLCAVGARAMAAGLFAACGSSGVGQAAKDTVARATEQVNALCPGAAS